MRPTSSALPFLIACIGIAIFSAMDGYMKGLSLALGAYNAMFWRTLVGTALAGALYAFKRSTLPSKEALKLHATRGAIAAIMATTFFYGIARVPLAEGIALSFIAPLITLYLAAAMLGETIGSNAIFASILGLAGVGVMLASRMGSASYDPEVMKGIVAVLVSAVFYAFNLILQRKQAQVASPFEIAFFQAAVVAVLLGSFAPFFADVPDASHWPDIAMSAFLSMLALLLLSWAYARAEAQVLVTVEYTAFIWAALFGWLWFSEAVTVTTLIGTTLIVAGCIIATRAKPAHVEITNL